MEVGVQVLAEPRNEVTVAKRVATAYLVFVAVDADGRPAGVAPRAGPRPPRTVDGSPRRRSGVRNGWPGALPS
jgi:acyl-CoA hydrolase